MAFTLYHSASQGEACLMQDGQWVDRFLAPKSAMLGGIYRLRIVREFPALDAYLLQGEGEEVLLRRKEAAASHRAGEVVLVEVFRDAYADKRALAREQLSVSAEAKEMLRRQLAFDPVPKRLATAWDPLARWLQVRGLSEKTVQWQSTDDLDTEPGLGAQRRFWLARTLGDATVEIVLDSTEAAHLIDVNQGPATLRLPAAQKAAYINEASLFYLVRAIKLRHWQGIVLVDALRMSKEEGANYLRALRARLREEHLPAKCLGFTRAGLVELLLRRP